ncbi:MAG: hypothetical protein LH466_08515 [Sphingomonas bacterium]|nr:hypothetical protein [Sphingomonas bacterium]
MAKAATAKSTTDKKKNKAAAATASIKVKTKKDKGAKSGKKAGSKRDGFDGLAKLVDHPLVADLLAAGAIAAVAAIAEHQMGKGQSSSKMVKAVGKAAAAAMGVKLMGDIGAIATAAGDAVKKS